MYTNGQLLKIFQCLICYTVVCDVYVCQETLDSEGKEALAYNYWVKESRDFLSKEGRWCDFTENTKGKFAESVFNKCGKAFTGHSIWEKGMLMRRLVVTWIVRYGKVLRWNVLKPVMKQGEVVDKAKFDIELVEDSGGSEDTELDKLRMAVSNSSLFTLQAINILMLTCSYQCYKGFLEDKRKPVLDIDGAAAEEPTSTAITDVVVEDESDVPSDFTSTFFLALKYLVVKPKNGDKDVFLISLLVNNGAKGLDASSIPTKSRKEQLIERRYVMICVLRIVFVYILSSF